MAAAVTIPLDVGGQALRLTFKFGTMGAAERELGRPITAELASGQIGLDMLGAVFWAVLQPAHLMTREATDNLVDEAGIEAVADAIGKGLKAYFQPDAAADDAAEADAGNAPKGKRAKAG